MLQIMASRKKYNVNVDSRENILNEINQQIENEEVNTEDDNSPASPEEAYRKEIFSKSLEELFPLLDSLCEEFIPNPEAGFMEVLQAGLKHFGIKNKEAINYDEFHKKYNKALHKVIVLHHKFAEENLLTSAEDEENDNVTYLIKFNKLFEVFYYWEQAIRSIWNVRKASHPLYDSSLNTDIGLFRFKPINPDANNTYQNLILYLLACLAERGWRRQVDQCMERIYTKDGFDTHAWKQVMDIQSFVYDRTQKDTNYQQWYNLTANANNAKNAIKYLTEVSDLHFIEVKKDRKLFSFPNGIYETAILNELTGMYEDRFYHHIKDTVNLPEGVKYVSSEICPKRSACKYFSKKFEEFNDVKDWYNIPTPCFQSILDYQEFPEEVCRWLYVLLCGRLLFEVGDLDEWQVLPFLKGKAKSGKSTILTRVCKQFFHALDVGVLSNNIEKKFGLSALKDKFMFIAPEIKGNIGLEQCDFQTIISGEDTSVAEKFKTASSVKWVVPGAMAGNEPPEYQDNQGSISRRLVVFNFSKKVVKGDTQLGKKLNSEIPILIKKGTMAYLEAINKYGKDDIWSVLPQYFKDTQDDMTEQINPLANFMKSDNVIFDPEEYCLAKDFKDAYNEFVKDNSASKLRWKKDFYEPVFEEHDVTVYKGQKIYKVTKRKKTAEWFIGIALASQSKQDEDTQDELE